jgi:membrane protein
MSAQPHRFRLFKRRTPKAPKPRRSRLGLCADGVAALLFGAAVFEALAPKDAKGRSAIRAGVDGWRDRFGRAFRGEAPAADLTPEAFDAREPGRGRYAEKPTQIPAKGWVDIGWRVFQGFNGDRVLFVAGGVTFFTLLATFPAIAAFVSLYGLFADAKTAQGVLALFNGALPPGVMQIVRDQMTLAAGRGRDTLSTAATVSLAVSIWSANASIKSLIYGLNVAYHETEKRNFIRYTLTTLCFTVGGLAFVLFASAVVVAAPIAAGWFGWSAPALSIGAFRWPLLFLAYLAMLSILYRFGPCRQRARWSWLTWGGAIAAGLSLLVSWLFSTYLGSSARYDRTYGPLGAMIGFMVWTWWSVTVILLGAKINAEMEHQTARDTTTGAPLPLGQRGALVADTVGAKRGSPENKRFTLDGAMETSRKRLKRRAQGEK